MTHRVLGDPGVSRARIAPVPRFKRSRLHANPGYPATAVHAVLAGTRRATRRGGSGPRSSPMEPSAQMKSSDLAFDGLTPAIVVVDADGRVERVSHAAASPPGGTVGQPVESALPWLAAAVRRVLAGAEHAGAETE